MFLNAKLVKYLFYKLNFFVAVKKFFIITKQNNAEPAKGSHFKTKDIYLRCENTKINL
jgi:hypothetical protein